MNEYVGELITDDECKKRIEKYHADNFSTFYMLTLDSNRFVSTPSHTQSRYYGRYDLCLSFMFFVRSFVQGDKHSGHYNTYCQYKHGYSHYSKSLSSFVIFRKQLQTIANLSSSFTEL